MIAASRAGVRGSRARSGPRTRTRAGHTDITTDLSFTACTPKYRARTQLYISALGRRSNSVDGGHARGRGGGVYSASNAD